MRIPKYGSLELDDNIVDNDEFAISGDVRGWVYIPENLRAQVRSLNPMAPTIRSDVMCNGCIASGDADDR